MRLIKVAFSYLRRYPGLAAICIALIVIVSFFEGASFGMIIPLVQSMTLSQGSPAGKLPIVGRLAAFSSLDQSALVSVIFVILFGVILFKNIFVYTSELVIARLRFGVIRDLRTRLMDRLIGYDMKYFDGSKTGELLCNLDAETMRMGNFVMSVLQLTALVGRITAYILLLLLISWKTSAVMVVLFAVVILPIETIMRKTKKIGELLSSALADYNLKALEILNGIRLIKGYGTEEFEKKRFGRAANALYVLFYKNRKYAGLIIPLSEVVILGIVVVYFLVLLNIVRIDIKGYFPFIAVYLLVLTRTLSQLNTINSYRSDAMNNLAAFDKYEETFNPDGKRSVIGGKVKPGKLRDAIDFRGVSFSYDGARQVLAGVTMKIPRGRMTAIVGVSGAGKTTLVNLIPRFYDVTDGSILVDGVNVKDLVLEDWRKKIGFVSQDVFILNASVKENISYGIDRASDRDIETAARMSNAHDFIMDLPDKYDTVLGERGSKLSGGQKQRISIARALMHNTEILILDEATSSLDSETEKLIRDAIDKLTKDRTVIAIAHRLSTVLHADNIVVLESGKIIESGRHGELLAVSGAYKKLYDTQFAGMGKDQYVSSGK